MDIVEGYPSSLSRTVHHSTAEVLVLEMYNFFFQENSSAEGQHGFLMIPTSYFP